MTSLSRLNQIILLGLLSAAGSIAMASKPAPEKAPPTTTLAGQSAQMDALGAPRGQAQVAGRIATDFVRLAGGEENAVKLVHALRNGTTVTLTSAAPASGGQGGTTPLPGSESTLTPPTGRMGWGNVFISLALAKNALSQAGITDPTGAELQAALLGGEITSSDGKTMTLAGVLTQRASGMGWGQIAQTYDAKLGPIVSSIKSANQRIATVPAVNTGAGSESVQGSGIADASTKVPRSSLANGVVTGRGVVSAAGVVSSPGHGKGLQGMSTANGPTIRATSAKGLTTAAGTSSGLGGGITSADGVKSNGQGHAYGRGMVTAAGATAGSSPAAMAGTRGHATTGITAATGVSVSTGVGAVATASGPGSVRGHSNGNGNGNGMGRGKGH